MSPEIRQPAEDTTGPQAGGSAGSTKQTFDRIKPPDRRLLEREESRIPDSPAADHEGRAALFSASEKPTTPGAGVTLRHGTRPAKTAVPKVTRTARPEVGLPPEDTAETGPPAEPLGDKRHLPTGRSVLHVECSHCGETCPMPLGTALRRAFPLALVAPTRSHPVFATCPCGERRTWLKPIFGLPR